MINEPTRDMKAMIESAQMPISQVQREIYIGYCKYCKTIGVEPESLEIWVYNDSKGSRNLRKRDSDF